MAKEKGKAGRNQIEINWKTVEDLLMAGCKGTEVASYLGIHKETLYDRVEKEFGISFTDYSYKFREKGDSLLKKVQFDTAVKLQDKSMLVWLGKNRLGQKDKHDVTSNDETVKPSWTINVVDPNKDANNG